MKPADIAHGRGPVDRAAALAAAAADTADPDVRAKIEAELNAALADVEAGSIDLDELVAALAALAGHAIDDAASLRAVSAGATGAPTTRDEERVAVLRECVAALHATGTLAPPDEEPAVPATHATPQEQRSGADRRLAERRAHADESPAARVNRWLHGQRRSGRDRRSGVPRRWSEAEPTSRDED
jgi:hypothetical protein